MPSGGSKRAAILEHVTARPGCTIKEIASASRIAHPTAAYHLASLEEEGRVESERYANKRHFFPSKVFDEWERRFSALLRADENMRVLEAVWVREWTYVKAVAAATRISRLTVAASARRLHALGLVGTEREGRTRALTPSRGVLRVRAETLVEKLPPDDPVRAFLVSLTAGR